MNRVVFLVFVFLPMFCATQNAKNHHLQLLAHIPVLDTIGGVWGYVDGQTEYALIAGQEKLYVYDVTDAINPKEVVTFAGNGHNGREIRTLGHYAYFSSENAPYLQRIDLSALPSVNPNDYQVSRYNAPSYRSHTLEVDTTTKHLYLYDYSTRVYDISTPTLDPQLVGEMMGYVHDGYVDNDTLYAARILSGKVDIVDFKDKSNPKLLSSTFALGFKPHNTWPYMQKRFLAVAEESEFAYVGLYDMQDLADVHLVSKFRTNPERSGIPHNISILNDYIHCAWYHEGFLILDASNPYFLVEVARFDFSDYFSGYWGAWGTYPFLPSGNILVTGRTEGLYVLKQEAIRPARILGNVIDNNSGLYLEDCIITFTDTSNTRILSDMDGAFRNSFLDKDTITLKIEKYGYEPFDTVLDISNGKMHELTVFLQEKPSFLLKSQALIDNPLRPLSNTMLSFWYKETLIEEVLTDSLGQFERRNTSDTITVTTDFWGVLSMENIILQSIDSILIFKNGYQDVFHWDKGWRQFSSSSYGLGIWGIGKPIFIPNFQGFSAQPDNDTPDLGESCAMTGNGPSIPMTDAVFDGESVFISPEMNLSEISNPTLNFSYYATRDQGLIFPSTFEAKAYLANDVDEVVQFIGTLC